MDVLPILRFKYSGHSYVYVNNKINNCFVKYCLKYETENILGGQARESTNFKM